MKICDNCKKEVDKLSDMLVGKERIELKYDMRVDNLSGDGGLIIESIIRENWHEIMQKLVSSKYKLILEEK